MVRHVTDTDMADTDTFSNTAAEDADTERLRIRIGYETLDTHTDTSKTVTKTERMWMRIRYGHEHG